MLDSPSDTGNRLTEATSVNVLVSLASCPLANGVVKLQVSVDHPLVLTTPSSIMVSGGSCNTPSVITVFYPHDGIVTSPSTASVTVSVSDPGTTDPSFSSAGSAVSVLFSLVNIDAPSLMVSPLSVNILAGQAPVAVQVALGLPPSFNVSVNVSISGSQISASPQTLEFTPDHFNVYQTIWLTFGAPLAGVDVNSVVLNLTSAGDLAIDVNAYQATAAVAVSGYRSDPALLIQNTSVTVNEGSSIIIPARLSWSPLFPLSVSCALTSVGSSRVRTKKI